MCNHRLKMFLIVQEPFYGMDGFCAYGVSSCDDRFVILVIACYYLLTQGAYLCKLYPYLFGHFLGFLLGVCDRGFLLLDQSLGATDLFFESCQFFFQEVESPCALGDVSFSIQSCFLLVEQFALLSNVSFQRDLRMT